MSNIKLSKSEENYLKSIFNLSEFGNKQVTTNSISKILNIEPASVTDMIKKLSKKNLIYHEKYKGLNKKDKTKNTKEQVLEQVQKLNVTLTWPKRILKSGPRKGLEIYDDCCYDRADAWVIGKAHLLENKKTA